MFHKFNYLIALAGVSALLLAAAPAVQAEMPASPSESTAPDHVVKGRVTDASGAPLMTPPQPLL